MKTLVNRAEIGCAGHFILSHRCLYRRHTRIDKNGTPYVSISTVGCLMPRDFFLREQKYQIEDIGYERKFETQVFALSNKPETDENCGCFQRKSRTELDFTGYNKVGDAQDGHEAMVAKWMDIAAVTDNPFKAGDEG